MHNVCWRERGHQGEGGSGGLDQGGGGRLPDVAGETILSLALEDVKSGWVREDFDTWKAYSSYCLM